MAEPVAERPREELRHGSRCLGNAFDDADREGGSSQHRDHVHRQQGVDHLYGLFAAFVSARGGGIEQKDLQGQDFYGDQALEAGMIDELSTRAAVVADLKSYVK